MELENIINENCATAYARAQEEAKASREKHIAGRKKAFLRRNIAGGLLIVSMALCLMHPVIGKVSAIAVPATAVALFLLGEAWQSMKEV